LRRTFGGHRERFLFWCSLLAGCLLLAVCLRGGPESEHWGEPITRQVPPPERGTPRVEFQEFLTVWTPGGRDPFGAPTPEPKATGRAGLALPPAPPLVPDMPPPPAVRPIDMLKESGL